MAYVDRALPVYKKTFSNYTNIEPCTFMFLGGTHDQKPIKNAMSIGLSGLIEDASQALQNEIDAFEKEEGDITIVKRDSKVSFTTMRDDDDYEVAAVAIEIEVSFTHHDDV
jgi:hypothetical protein